MAGQKKTAAAPAMIYVINNTRRNVFTSAGKLEPGQVGQVDEDEAEQLLERELVEIFMEAGEHNDGASE